MVSRMIRTWFILLLFVGSMIPINASADISGTHTIPMVSSQNASAIYAKDLTPLTTLISEALQNNPEIQAALQEREAARQRILPAKALDDPMLEAGVINAPLASSPFNREDMTMKMIDLSQRFPFPGKLGLRKGVASKNAEAVDYGYQETISRVVRDLRVAYFDLGLTLEMTKLVEKNKLILEDFTHLAVDHYVVGMGAQADAFKAQTEVSRMQDELLRLTRERPVFEAEIIRALGRSTYEGALLPEPLHMHEASLNLESLRE